jgi:hypothetical protein
MRAKEARDIPIDQYLASEGIVPKRALKNGRELWYSSPIRSGDSTPSFKVDTLLNLWFDHGIATGGNVIDLVCALKVVTVREALAILAATGLAHVATGTPRSASRSSRASVTQSVTASATQVVQSTRLPLCSDDKPGAEKTPAGQKEKDGAFVVLSVKDIIHPALVQYLQRRAIDIGIARRHLKEIRFRPSGGIGQFFALGFPCGAGFDSRSALFKGFVGSGKSVTFIDGGETSDLVVFEGFMDYLAFLTHRRINAFAGSVLILHSTALKKQGLDAIAGRQFGEISLYLDNDDAGRGAVALIRQSLPDARITDASAGYADFKDFNDWLIAERKRTPHG